MRHTSAVVAPSQVTSIAASRVATGLNQPLFATVPHGDAPRDFDSGGKSDVLWRNDNGSVAMWLMNGRVIASNPSLGPVGSDWRIPAHDWDLT